MLHSVTRGTGRPILVLHGAKLDYRHMLDAIEPAFSGVSGWKRVYIDLPGHGQSPAPPDLKDMKGVVQAVIDFAEANHPGQPVALIGESRGSHVAEGLAMLRPDLVAGLCLIAPGGNSPGSIRPDHETLVPASDIRDTLPEAAKARFDRLVVQSPDIAEKIVATKLPAAAQHDPDLEARIQKAFGFSDDPQITGGQCEAPSLILSGRQDSIAGYDDALAMLPRFPRATFALLDTAGHSLAWERPDLVAALIRDWLDRLAA
ncbi:MAG: alpha/beta hydrolase [Roseovarius indicus]